MPEPAELDAVTFDANGTLLEVVDPVPQLVELLRARAVERSPAEVSRAFREEGSYYGANCHRGRDASSLAELHRECAEVFFAQVSADPMPPELPDEYSSVFTFRLLPHAIETLRMLRRRGLALAIVSSWDVSMHDRLVELGLAPLVDAAVASPDAGVSKPDARIFEHALGLLGVRPERALHVGDSPADEDGAAAAGMHFVPVPISTAFAAWR